MAHTKARKRQRGAEDEQRRPGGGKGSVSPGQARSSKYPRKHEGGDQPTPSHLKGKEGESIWAVRGVGRGDRSILKKAAGTAGRAAGGVKKGLEAAGRPIDRAGSAAGRGIASAVKGAGKAALDLSTAPGRAGAGAVRKAASAVKGAGALKPGGILRTGGQPAKVAAKSRPASTWKEDRKAQTWCHPQPFT